MGSKKSSDIASWLIGKVTPYIISFYGAFIADPNICICMEFMDKGSLDGIYKKIGPIDIEVVGKVAHAVLEGLTYLYDVHRIIHRGAYTDLQCERCC